MTTEAQANDTHVGTAFMVRLRKGMAWAFSILDTAARTPRRSGVGVF